MDNINILNNPFGKINKITRPEFIFFGIISAMLLTVYVWASLILGFQPYLLGIAAGSLIFLISLKYPRFWLYTVIMSMGLFFLPIGEGFSALDFVFGVFYNGGLYLWLIWTVLIKREKIIRSAADLLIVLFFIFILLNFFIVYFNGADLFLAVREYLLFSLVLYYFPFRKYFDNEKDLVRLILVFFISSILLYCYYFYAYSTNTMSNVRTVLDYENASRIACAHLTSLCMFGLIFTINQKKVFKTVLMLIFTSISVIALVSLFARTFWIIFLASFPIIFIFVPREGKFKLLVLLAIIGSIFVYTMTYVFKDTSAMMFKLLEKRFESSAKGSQDVSVLSRLMEYDVVIHQIEKYPLGGNGMGKKFTFFYPIAKITAHTSFTHNGYLYFAYRLGIPLTLFYIIALLIFTWKSLVLSWKVRNIFYKSLALFALCNMILILGSDFSTTAFNARDGIFVQIFTFAFIGIIENKKNHVQQANNSKNILFS